MNTRGWWFCPPKQPTLHETSLPALANVTSRQIDLSDCASGCTKITWTWTVAAAILAAHWKSTIFLMPKNARFCRDRKLLANGDFLRDSNYMLKYGTRISAAEIPCHTSSAVNNRWRMAMCDFGAPSRSCKNIGLNPVIKLMRGMLHRGILLLKSFQQSPDVFRGMPSIFWVDTLIP